MMTRENVVTSMSWCHPAHFLTKQSIVTVVTVALLCVTLSCVQGLKCKMPNSGCSEDSECCSGECVQAHPGTNYRCSRLSSQDFCLSDYQCEGRLVCSSNNSCCAGYWDFCDSRLDCCDARHLCFEMDCFNYKRCLFPEDASSGHKNTGLGILGLIFVITILNI